MSFAPATPPLQMESGPRDRLRGGSIERVSANVPDRVVTQRALMLRCLNECDS